MLKWIWLISLSAMVFAEPPKVFLASPTCDTVSFVGTETFLLAYSFEPDITYTWTLSNGETLHGDSVFASFDGGGLHQVTLVATNASGESSSPQSRFIYLTDSSTIATQPKIQALRPSANVAPPGASVRIEPTIADADGDGPYQYYWCWTADDVTFRADTPVLETAFSLPAGETERTYAVSLFVVDQAGNASFTNQVSIFISSGNLPPIGGIVEPASQNIEVQKGTEVTFRAEATDVEGNLPIAYRWFMPDESIATGSVTSFRFEQEGNFVITLSMEDSLGNVSPIGENVFVNVSAAANPDIPETFIQLPSISTRVFVGESLIFSGLIATSNPDLMGYWIITDVATNTETARLEGNQPGRFKFASPGLFLVRYAVTLFGVENEASFANTRLVAVHERNENEAPLLQFDSGNALRTVRNGNAYELAMNVVDPEGEATEVLWMFEGDLQPTRSPTINLTANVADEDFFQGVAYRLVRGTALDATGKPARQPLIFSIAVYRDRKPPMPIVNDLDLGEVIFAPFNSGYPIQAVITDDPGVPLQFFWTISYIDDLLNPIFSGNEGVMLEPLVLNRPGIVLINLRVQTADGQLANAFSHTHYLYAFDPTAFPTVTVTKPKAQNVIVETGGKVTFEGLINDPNLLVGPQETFGFLQIASNMVWDITRDSEPIGSFTQNEPLAVVFEEPGNYVVSLSAENSIGLKSVASEDVAIQVIGLRPDGTFEPNDTRETAADLALGNYGGLSVGPDDPVDWYRFELTQAGAAIELEFDLSGTTDDAKVRIFQGQDLV